MAHIEINELRLLVTMNKVVWTEHVAIRLRERGLKREDVIKCIVNGEIIEQYPTDTPLPSCLVLGFCTVNKPLHVVVGLDRGVHCGMITAYRPSLEKWRNDFKKRKGTLS